MPPTPSPKIPRVKARYTTVDGRRMQSFSDGTSEQINLPTKDQAAQLGSPTPAPSTTPTTDIPVGAIDGAPTGLKLPELPQISDAAGPAKTAAGAFLEKSQAEANTRLQQTEAKGTASENKVRELMGLANTESATRDKLEETRGVTGIEEQMRKAEESIASQIAEIDAFDLQNVTDLEGMRIEGSKRDLSKRTFGAQAAEFNLQRTIERAGMAAGLRATVAGNLALQGNLEAATEQVDKALKAIYDPIRQGLEMEKFFLQRNDVRLGEDRAEARELRMKGIDRQFKEIDRAQDLSDQAVMSGYAGASEIKQLTSLSGDPVAQAAYAQTIVAQGAREMMALERAAKNASISASGLSSRKALMDLAVAGDPKAIAQLGFDPGAPARQKLAMEQDKILSSQIDKQNNIIDRLTKVSGMTGAIKSSTGVIQSGFLTGLLPKGGAGAVTPGDITGGFKGQQNKAEFLSEINYLLAGEGFQQFSKLKEEGVNLTPVSELEFNKIMGSANMLSSAAQMKDGKITGFGNLSPEVIQREINTMIQGAATIRDEKAAIRAGVSYEELLMLQQSVSTAQ